MSAEEALNLALCEQAVVRREPHFGLFPLEGLRALRQACHQYSEFNTQFAPLAKNLFLREEPFVPEELLACRIDEYLRGDR